MSSTNGYVIDTQGLSKEYKEVKVLDNLNLKVQKNSIFGFLGPNGAGKSTTIKMLLGLTRPSSGKANIFGKDITRDSLAVRKRVGYLAQEPRYYDHMTARQTLRYTAHFFYSGPSELLEARINEMLELTGLADKANRSIKGFSGGERQRLGIAQAQISHPDLLILDSRRLRLTPRAARCADRYGNTEGNTPQFLFDRYPGGQITEPQVRENNITYCSSRIWVE